MNPYIIEFDKANLDGITPHRLIFNKNGKEITIDKISKYEDISIKKVLYENVILNHGTNVIWKKLKFIDKTLPYELAKKDLYTKIDKVCNYFQLHKNH